MVEAIIINKIEHQTLICEPVEEEGLKWRRHSNQTIQTGKFNDDVNIEDAEKRYPEISNDFYPDESENID